MSPAILVASTVALMAAAGVTVKVIHDNDKKPGSQVAGTEQPTTASIATPPADFNLGRMTTLDNSSDDNNNNATASDSDGSKTRKVVVRTVTTKDGKTTETTNTFEVPDVSVMALRADEDIFASLGLEPEAVENICTGLRSADGMTNCSDGSAESVKVCMVKDGDMDEVVLMDRRGPMPVMFTSTDGRGHVVQSKTTVGVDPNKLVPVAAEGCGENVLMWFQPTEEFVFSMPEELGDELNEVLQYQVQIREISDGKTVVTTTSRDGETVTEVIRNFDGEGKEIRPQSACRAPATKEELDEIFNLDFLTVNNNAPNNWTTKDGQTVNVDSIMKAAQAQIREAMANANVDGNVNVKAISVTTDARIMTDDEMPETLLMQHDGKAPKVITISRTMRTDSIGNVVISMDEDVDIEVHKMIVKSAPNVSRRCIILSSKRNTFIEAPEDEVPTTSLQETRLKEGAISAPNVFPNPTLDGDATMDGILLQREPAVGGLCLEFAKADVVKAHAVQFPTNLLDRFARLVDSMAGIPCNRRECLTFLAR